MIVDVVGVRVDGNAIVVHSGDTVRGDQAPCTCTAVQLVLMLLWRVVVNDLGDLSGTRLDIGQVRWSALSSLLQQVFEHDLDVDQSSFVSSSSLF